MKIYFVIDVYVDVNGVLEEELEESISAAKVFDNFDKAVKWANEVALIGICEDDEELTQTEIADGLWKLTYEDGSGNMYILEKELE